MNCCSRITSEYHFIRRIRFCPHLDIHDGGIFISGTPVIDIMTIFVYSSGWPEPHEKKNISDKGNVTISGFISLYAKFRFNCLSSI